MPAASASPGTAPSPAVRHTANCCLVLLTIPTAVLVWFWYTLWHAGHVDDGRERAAVASVRRQADDAADGAARALTASTGTGTGTDHLMGLIWRHTRAPVITYDRAGHAFTAVGSEFAAYDRESGLWGGGPERVTRCFASTFTRGPDRVWTARVEERDPDVCGPGTSIGSTAESARRDIAGMDAADMTGTGVQRAVDPTGRLGFEVRSRTRKGRTTTVTASVRAVGGTAPATTQCYRFTRRDGDGSEPSVTAVPVAAC
ncbi:hypothetical protein GCM10010129_26020 [Streptomyces fumigatiscleroticus]|nr:hypothetical protein GCM10010129_26020 [Streptomyces fumigatiscleroticus]